MLITRYTLKYTPLVYSCNLGLIESKAKTDIGGSNGENETCMVIWGGGLS